MPDRRYRLLIPHNTTIAMVKDNVLATDCDPFTFNRLCKMITEFIERCQAISISASKNSESTKANGTITENDDGLSASISSESPLNGLRSPLMSIMQQQTVKFQRKFFEERRQELG